MSDALSSPPWPRRTLHELVAEQADRTPDRVAVRCGDRSLTYRDLAAAGRRAAARLAARGVGPGHTVAVMVDRSVELPVALLAVLASGAAFVPVDPGYPRERQAHMLADSGATTTLTVGRLADRAGTADVVVLDAPDEDDATAAADVLPAVASGDLAYIMYTSGSTGRPKGVAVDHGCLVKGVLTMGAAVRPEPGDVWLSVTSASFDPVLIELFLPLVHGSTIVIASEQQVLDGEALHEVLAASGASVLQATPLTWRMLLDAGWAGGLRVGLCGGETLAPSLAAQLAERCGQVWNIYGPTETTVWSTAHLVTGDERDTVPVGRPLPDTTVHVLDAERRAVAAGESGEVWIGGGGVTRGYHGRPELTDECFVADPFGPPGARLYRTGDLGRLREDGALELLGRADHQVKIRGHRVELGEIENWLQEHPSVAGAAVVPQPDGEEQRLVAYVRPGREHLFDEAELRAHAALRLPRHMVPGTFVRVDVWPRTPSGKIDRRALPVPAAPAAEAAAPAATAWDDELTAALAGIWQDVLGAAPDGEEANFFGLGGHSLQVMQMVKRIRAAFGVRMNAARLMQAPTLGEQAALLRAAVTAAGTPDPVPAAER
ncbi:non-ribosomal peptide synthetase [Streptomyces sp. NPDC021096]|uniref:non-ribosomal peptide synthetase n=1 Tax=Streptomyces sp. NPDC021096 TaxID=3154792 RepID=UPI00340B11EF